MVDRKWVFIEHAKISRKYSRTIRQVEKVSQVSDAEKKYTSPLCSESIKNKIFFDEKKPTNNAKIRKQSHAYKG